MQEIVSTITSKGQVTIPAEVRRRLGVKDRDKIIFVLDESGEIKLRAPRYPTIESLRGIAGVLPQPLSWREVKEIAREERATEVTGSA